MRCIAVELSLEPIKYFEIKESIQPAPPWVLITAMARELVLEVSLSSEQFSQLIILQTFVKLFESSPKAFNFCGCEGQERLQIITLHLLSKLKMEILLFPPFSKSVILNQGEVAPQGAVRSLLYQHCWVYKHQHIIIHKINLEISYRNPHQKHSDLM